MQQWALIKLDLLNTGIILPKGINSNYARSRPTGCALSSEMKERGVGNKGGLSGYFYMRDSPYVVLLMAMIGAH